MECSYNIVNSLVNPLDRHADDPRFARLLGQHEYNGWGREGPNPKLLEKAPVGLFD